MLGATSVDRWSYAASKGVCEQMLYGVHRKTGLPFSIVRFFNVYGPRQTPIYVVSQTVQRVLNGERPDLYDGGGQTRCLTYVERRHRGRDPRRDQARGDRRGLQHRQRHREQHGRGGGHGARGRRLGPEPFPVDTREKYGAVYEDIGRRVPAVEKAERVLGWKATTCARDGIAKTVAWARETPWYLALKA